VTVVQLATASLLSFLMVVPMGEALPGFSWLLLFSAVGLGLTSAVIQVAMNWAQQSVFADAGHIDLCRGTGVGRRGWADCRGAVPADCHGRGGVDRGGGGGE